VRLRSKLILVGMVILVLPWTAWRYLQETERFLREGQSRVLEATAQVIARAFAQDYRRAPWPRGLYVRRAEHPPTVDGYADEWTPWLPFAHALDDWATLTLAEDDSALYLLLRVRDFAIVYDRREGSAAESADHILLSLREPDSEHLYLVSTEAPGWVRAEPLAPEGAVPIRGEWQEGPNGYSVELRIPNTRPWQGLGIAVVDVRPGAETRTASTGAEVHGAPLPLTRPVAAELLSGLSPASGRVWLVNGDGWVLARSGALRAGEPSERGWLHDLAYRLLLAPPLDEPYRRGHDDLRLDGAELRAALDGTVASGWRPADATVVATAAVPVLVDGDVVGAVVVEQATDALQLLANQAALRLLGGTSLAFAGALTVLILFASRLSLRIRRLRDAAAAAVVPAADLSAELPLSRDRDELGDLARTFDATLRALRGYTEYLRTLAAKLSHELRTPLAVVSSSLDNLGQSSLPDEAEPYLRRARQGADRLSRILRAMSEADRLERSIERESGEWLTLDLLLAAAADSYRALVGGRELRLAVEPGDYRVYGSPDLIVQLLDKLIDNAVGFTPADGWIRLGLRRHGDAVELSVANLGQPLPARMRDRLFDSLVSLRAERGEQPHLGLGLYVVRLIAELHGGYVRADDLAEAQGAEFTVGLRGMPGADEAAGD